MTGPVVDVVAWLDDVDQTTAAATDGWTAEVYRFNTATGIEISGGKITRRADDGAVLLVTDQVHRANDAEFIAAARDVVPRLSAALRAVMELHRPLQMYAMCPKGWHGCGDDQCREDINNGGHMHVDCPDGVCCAECWSEDAEAVDYPCATVAAVRAAAGGEAQ